MSNSDSDSEDESLKQLEAQLGKFKNRNVFRHKPEEPSIAEQEAKHDSPKQKPEAQKSKKTQETIFTVPIDLPGATTKPNTINERKEEVERLQKIIIAKLTATLNKKEPLNTKTYFENMLHILQLEYLFKNESKLTMELKIMKDSDFLQLYYEELSTHEGLRSIPPDMKLYLYDTLTEHQRAILFHWYSWRMFGNFAEFDERQKAIRDNARNDYKVPDFPTEFKKLSLNFLKMIKNVAQKTNATTTEKPSKPFNQMTDEEIIDFTTQYMDSFLDRLEKNSSSLPIEDKEDQRRFIIYSSEMNDALFWDKEASDRRDAMRFYLLCEYPAYFFQIDKNLRRFVFLEGELFNDDSDDEERKASGKSKFKPGRRRGPKSAYQKSLETNLKKLEKQIADLSLSGEQKTNLDEEIDKLKKKLIKPESQSRNGGVKLTPEEYKQRAVINTREWRKKHPEKVYDSTLLWNKVKNEKYKNDTLYQFKVLRHKYLTSLQEGYITSPKVETLLKYGITFDGDIGNFIESVPDQDLTSDTIEDYKMVDVPRYLSGEVPDWVIKMPPENKNRARNLNPTLRPVQPKEASST